MDYGIHTDPRASIARLQEQTGGQVVDGTVGRFIRESEYSEMLSAQKGEPVYVEHDYCLIGVPGNVNASTKQLVRKTFPDGREVIVGEYHIRRFALAWDAFLRGDDLRPAGTLLEDCEAIPKTRIAHLKAMQIRTVEELANLPDGSLRRVGADARALQRACLAWLEKQQRTSPESIAAMEARIKELEAKLSDGNGNDQATPAERSPGRRAAGS